MPATFEWDEANGAGQTVTHNIANGNWKSEDSSTNNYASFPVRASENSFEKWIYGHFSGSYNQILNGKFAHTAGAMGTGLSIMGPPNMTADGDRLAYTTPSSSVNANLTTNMTSVIGIGSGVDVWFGPTGPANSGKAASTTSNPAYTNYLTTQLQTTGSAAPGDTATATFTLQYNEN